MKKDCDSRFVLRGVWVLGGGLGHVRGMVADHRRFYFRNRHGFVRCIGPDCVVTATSVQTGLKETVRTLEMGFYTFGVLPAGTYSVAAQKTGFRNSKVSNVVLDAYSHRRVDFTLEVGEISESISVSAAAQQVQTSSGEVG
jgi:hypothetical protein